MTNTIPTPDATQPPEPVTALNTPVIEERAHWATPLVKMWVAIVAFAWFFAKDVLERPWEDFNPSSFNKTPIVALIVLGIVVLVLVASYWSWWTTLFVIDDHEVRIENRGAFQESKRVAFTRIQSIDITQPFAARLLGLAQLTIDAGSDESTTLSYLTRRRAAELRDYLMARAHRQEVSTRDTRNPEASAWDDLAVHDHILIRLTPLELALSALLDHGIWMIVIITAIPMVIAVVIGEPLLAGMGVLPMVFAVGGVVWRKVIGQFNYTLAQTTAGLRITRGLTSLSSQTVPAPRIQAVRIHQPVLWRLVDRYRVEVVILGKAGDEDSSSSTLLLPIGTRQQMRTALAAIWPNFDIDTLVFTGNPKQTRWLDPLSYSWLGHATDEQVLAARTGWLTRRQFIVPHARLQALTLEQGPLQRRLGVASVHIQIAGSLLGGRIVHMDAVAARTLIFDEMTRVNTIRSGEPPQ